MTTDFVYGTIVRVQILSTFRANQSTAKMAPRASARTQAKTYDRPAANAKSKGKGKAPVHDLGAPSTHSQPSRKGKKAWRKNIDITHEEEALEKSREDERVTG